jgi:DNA polymerase I-like protein with 3'-5' exonuclease and polymerase domains
MVKGRLGGALQPPLFETPCSWKAPDMGSLPSWAGASRICVDVETKDEQLTELGIGVRRGGYVTGVSFAIDGMDKGFYLPVAHEGGDNLDAAQVWRYLRAQGKAFKGEIVGARLDYDLDYLWENEVMFPQVKYYRDIQIADPLLYELHLSYSLANIGKRFGVESKNEGMLRQAAIDYGLHPKKEMWRLPARFVGEYAETDTQSPLTILRKQEPLLDALDQDGHNRREIWDVESQVLPILVKMRRRGVLVDWEKLAYIEAWSEKRERQLLAIVARETGVQIAVGDVWKAEVMSQALEATGYECRRTADGAPEVTQEVFAEVGGKVGWALGKARKVNKLRTTFASSLRRHQTNGRIHCTFNQIARETEAGDQKGARYGRLSAVDPNLQQQPSRDYFAALWRSVYIPEPGAIWACNDYSQQEPRWTTHFAAAMDLPGARKAAQAYCDNPKLDNHEFMAKLTGLDRKHAKNIYLGLCYGEGGAKLCRDLGLPTRWCLSYRDGRNYLKEYFTDSSDAYLRRGELGDGFVYEAAGQEGQKVIDTFDARAPFIRKLAKRAEKRANSRGVVKTILKRVLNFESRGDGTYDWTYRALNRVIQGSSADQMKKAMIAIDAGGYFLQLQVHDETDSSCGSVKEAKEIGRLMTDAVTARVPFMVDTEVGPSWGEIKEAV